MNIKILIFAMLFLLQASTGSSQSISAYLISGSGAEYTTDTGNKTVWTLGDFMTQTIGTNDFATQGFLQAELWKITAITDVNSLEAKIYPNPFAQYFYVELPDDDMFDITIFDLIGKVILKLSKVNSLQYINTSHLKANEYILTIKNTNKKQICTYKLIHIK